MPFLDFIHKKKKKQRKKKRKLLSCTSAPHKEGQEGSENVTATRDNHNSIPRILHHHESFSKRTMLTKQLQSIYSHFVRGENGTLQYSLSQVGDELLGFFFSLVRGISDSQLSLIFQQCLLATTTFMIASLISIHY